MNRGLPLVFTPSIAVGFGFSRTQIRRRLDSGLWVPIARGFYGERQRVERVRRDPTASYLIEVIAALQRFGDAYGAFWSASAIHDLPLPMTSPWPISLVRRNGSSGRRPGFAVHVAALPIGHVTKVGALRSTTVARTLVDLGRRADFADAVTAADAALNRGLVTKNELREVLSFQAGWPGVSYAESLIEFADGLAESPLESRSRVRFHESGMPQPELQVEFFDAEDTFVARSDFYWRAHGVIGEADGKVKYTDGERKTLWDEKKREDALRRLGHEVIRWTYEEIEYRLEEVVNRFWAAAKLARQRGVGRSTFRPG